MSLIGSRRSDQLATDLSRATFQYVRKCAV